MRSSRMAGICTAALALAGTAIFALPSAASAGTKVCTTRSGVGETCIRSEYAANIKIWRLYMTYKNESSAPQHVTIYLYRDASPDRLKSTSQPDYDQPGQTTDSEYSVLPGQASCGEPFYAIGESYKDGATSYQDVFSPDTISCQ